MTLIADFDAITAPTPDLDALAERMEELHRTLEAAATPADGAAVVRAWDELRREVETWSSLVDLRFNQDTANEEHKRAREQRDELLPRWTELEVAMKRALLVHPLRAGIAAEVGEHAFALWEVDVLAFDPAIKEDLVAEAKLEAEYTELMASAEFEYLGEKLNLATLRKFVQHADREVRHGALQQWWNWFAEHGGEFDRIYDELVRLRTAMAEKLGFNDFVELGYKRMKRIDYDRPDVERFRAAVREHVVPLATELCRRQAEALGVEKLMAWDERVQDPRGNPRPNGDHDWMVARAQEMFDAMDAELGAFFGLMNGGRFLDLKSRQGKSSGGFCTSFPTAGMPFVFANFNGTKDDVEVFTHEIGHAFQCYQSRDHVPLDFLWPTMESCEIHSMSLEFLTWPHMDKFFGDDAERFRRMHLIDGLVFLPYGVAVDHFQHEVYSRPEASPAARHAIWLVMERTYLPWRDWGDLAYPAKGGRWQAQPHIFGGPFYYIDYTLAQTCAMQFWLRAEREDRGAAMKAYVDLCRRGGQAPFQELARSAGLKSPFDDGCLAEVVGHAREVLAV